MEIDHLTLSEWGDELPKTGFEVFHLPEALSVLEEHTKGELHLLGGFRGDRLMGMLPLFVREGPLGTAIISSPPPGMQVPNLGPILLPASPKQSKREKLNRRFVESGLNAVGLDERSLCFIVCSTAYRDPRPYEWRGLTVDTSFTYHLDIGDASTDELLSSLSKGRRREIKRGIDLGVTVEFGDIDDARRVHRDIRTRLAETGEPLGLSWEFVRNLIEALDNRARVHVARGPDGEFLGGIVALYSNDAAFFWLGGARETYENISVNSLVHWDIIRTIVNDPELNSVTRYDMVGAGIPRLSKYKSSFSPDLKPYYVVKSSGAKMAIAEATYNAMTHVTAGLDGAKERYRRAVNGSEITPGSAGEPDEQELPGVSAER